MKTFQNIAVSVLVVLLPACGQQRVELADQSTAGHANAGRGGSGKGGSSGKSGAAGKGGTSGRGGTGNGGTGGSAGDGGAGGESGVGGESGTGGLGGTAGLGGLGGVAGLDVAGEGGMGGENGTLLEVTSTNPADQDPSVPTNKMITATFNETMDPTTVPAHFVVLGPGPGFTVVPGVVGVVGSVATFDPDNDLDPDTTFEATIDTGATALSGDALADDYVWHFHTGTQIAQQTPQLVVPLGTSSNFAVLASAAITNIPTSLITGDVGLTPDAGSNITGFSMPLTCPEVVGLIYKVDASGPACAVIDPVLLDNAKIDAGLAFVDATAAVRGTPQAISGDLNGLTLYPGLYESSSSLEISPGGLLYLDAQGDSSAVFIIRSATTITTSATSEVVLAKGAKATNIYWTAGSSVTLGTNSIMKGTLLAKTAISLLTGANLEGRALNQGAAAEAITLDTNTITVPSP